MTLFNILISDLSAKVFMEPETCLALLTSKFQFPRLVLFQDLISYLNLDIFVVAAKLLNTQVFDRRYIKKDCQKIFRLFLNKVVLLKRNKQQNIKH